MTTCRRGVWRSSSRISRVMQVRKLPPQNERNDCKNEERGEWSDPAQARTVGLFGTHYLLLARERPVSDTMWVRRFLALPAFEILDVLLIVAFEPDHFGVVFEGEYVGRDAIQKPAIMGDHHRTAGKAQ